MPKFIENLRGQAELVHIIGDDVVGNDMLEPLKPEQLVDMADVLNNLADDLLESGIDEWDSVDEAISSTVDNLRSNLITVLTEPSNPAPTAKPEQKKG